MEKLSKIWEWFNGKKTNIGMIIDGIGTLLLIIPLPIPGWIAPALLTVGSMLGYTGISHKIIKQGGIKSTINNIKNK